MSARCFRKGRKEIENKKVLIALGLGGEASNPDRFFLIPIDSLLRYKHIPEKYIVKYRVENPRREIKEHIRNYFFEEVFKESKN